MIVFHVDSGGGASGHGGWFLHIRCFLVCGVVSRSVAALIVSRWGVSRRRWVTARDTARWLVYAPPMREMAPIRMCRVCVLFYFIERRASDRVLGTVSDVTSPNLKVTLQIPYLPIPRNTHTLSQRTRTRTRTSYTHTHQAHQDTRQQHTCIETPPWAWPCMSMR